MAASLSQLDFVNLQSDWALRSGELLVTTDGGESWRDVPARIVS